MIGAVRTTMVLATLVSVVLYIAPLLLDAPLTDPDEGLHAGIAQEMRERGDLVVPRFLGQAFLDKPILFFWTQLASISAFGENTAAARLPGMLFALLGIATTGWLARVLFGPPANVGRALLGPPNRALSGPPHDWIAATCYATMALPFLLAQAPVHDMALVPFTNISLGYLWRLRGPKKVRAAGNKAGSAASWELGVGGWELALAGIALGLSILTKGLEGVAIVGVGYGLYLVLARAITWKVVWQGMAVLAIAVVIALPWYLAMEAREPGYLRYYFIDRHLLGFATDTQRHGGQPWWFYLPLAAGGGLPWILYVERAGVGRALSGPPKQLLWTWLGGSLVLLSLSGSKAVTYLLPVMPAIAILAARSWVAALAEAGEGGDPLRTRRLLHAAVFFVIAASTPWAASRFANQPVTTGEAVAFGALSGAWLWLAIGLRHRPAAYAWPRLVVATGATYAMAFALLGPPIAQAHSARDLAGYFNTPGSLPGTIYIMDGRVSFVYYLRPEVRHALRADQIRNVTVEQLAAMRPFPRDAVVAVPADLAGRLSRVPQLANATRQAAGRYVVVSP